MKKLVIHTPKLAAVRFVGAFDKKLFEVGAKKLPILKKDDDNVVIVTELEASLFARTPHFEAVDIDALFVNENDSHNVTDTELPVPCDNIEQFIKTAIIDVLGRYENGDYQVCNVGNQTDNWRVPKDVFESTYESNEIVGNFASDKNQELSPLKELSTFEDDKEELETYGKLFGINLDKRYAIEDMYSVLVSHTLKDVEVKDLTEEQDEYKLPFAEDIDTLDLDAVKLACDHVNITKGNKGIDKLKALLLPYLPKKEQ